MTDQASPQQQLDFLAGEVRKALAYFDRMPLQKYFDQVDCGDPIALAILGAHDHLAPALNVLGLAEKQLVTNDRPDPELDRTLSAVNDAMNQPGE